LAPPTEPQPESDTAEQVGTSPPAAEADPSASLTSEKYPNLVTSVLNGDTIVVANLPVNVQLVGIDAQEPTYNQCYGSDAKRYVALRIENRPVRLEESPVADAYGRYMAYVWYSHKGRDTCLNDE